MDAECVQLQQVSFYDFSAIIEKTSNLHLYTEENCEGLYQKYWQNKKLYGILKFNKSTGQFMCYIYKEDL